MKFSSKVVIGGVALAVLGGIGTMQLTSAKDRRGTGPASASEWSSPQTLDGVRFSDRVDGLALDSAGNGVIVAGPTIWTTSDGVWSPSVVGLTATTNNASAVVAVSGRTIAAWDTSDGVWYESRTPDGLWGKARKLAIKSRLTRLAIDDNGDAIVASVQARSDSSGQYRYTAYTQRIAADGTEETPTLLGPILSNDDFDMSISSNGNALVTWIDTNSVVQLKSGSLMTGNWTSSTTHTPTPDMHVATSTPRAQINNAGDAVVSLGVTEWATIERHDGSTWSDWTKCLFLN